MLGISYRLNIFGFPNAKFLPHQNLGLLDQRMALEWIRDNIGVFGGDAARITLFGSSAGASSIDMHRYAWAEDPIAAGFILQSGNRMIRGGGAWPGLGGKPGPSGNLSINETIGGFPSMEGSSSCGGVWTSDESRQCDQNSAWFFASTKVGCGGKEAGERTLTCMRSKPWKDVLDAIKPIPYIPALGTGQFGPIVDEKLVFGDYNNRTLAGNVAKQVSYRSAPMKT
jgi:cholinesterase